MSAQRALSIIDSIKWVDVLQFSYKQWEEYEDALYAFQSVAHGGQTRKSASTLKAAIQCGWQDGTCLIPVAPHNLDAPIEGKLTVEHVDENLPIWLINSWAGQVTKLFNEARSLPND